MRKITATVVTLALLIIPGASIHVAGAESAQQPQNQKSTTISAKTVADVTPATTSTTPAPAPSPVTVTVQPGDTLSGIATANNTTYARLYDANTFIADPNLIYPGQQVTIPGNDDQLTDRTAPTPTPTVVTVRHGDSLSSIATANNTTAQRLYDANTSISDPNTIYAGEQITIPTSNEQLTDRTMTAPATAAAATSTSTPAAAPQPVAAPAPVVHTSAAPAATTTPAATSSTASTGTPDNSAKAYIYAHESGNNPNATNAEGCYGLGQDCSGELKTLCGDDYACQDAFFDNYAQSRYGGWANAQAFWEAHHWW